MEMSVAQRDDDTVVVSFAGNIRELDAVQISTMGEEQKDAGATTVICDLSRVKLIDSCGLGGFIYAHGILQQAGKKLVLAAPQKQIYDMLVVCNLNRVFSIVPSIDEAVENRTGTA